MLLPETDEADESDCKKIYEEIKKNKNNKERWEKTLSKLNRGLFDKTKKTICTLVMFLF